MRIDKNEVAAMCGLFLLGGGIMLALVLYYCRAKESSNRKALGQNFFPKAGTLPDNLQPVSTISSRV
jgi:hypothetical protein